MAIVIKGPKDVIAGTFFAVVGVALFTLSQDYRMGTAVSMGPGYFPALCGIALALLGIGAVIKGLTAREYDPIPDHPIVPLILILLSIVSFALLIERAGLVVATFVCLFFACFQRVFTRPLEVLAIFVVLTAFNIIVFVYLFEMTLPIFWWRS